MSDVFSQPIAEPLRADYNIYRFTDAIYKIVRFNSTAPLGVHRGKEEHQHYENKLDASLSRTRRMILEKALCNDWRYFCTFTIAESNFDRKDLVSWHEKFSQWLRDQRKKYRKLGMDMDFPYLLIPEQHKDGSWHMHGLFGDISPLLVSFRELRSQGVRVPDKLVNGDYWNWPDYQHKFGYCSFGEIRNKVAVSFYVTKYMTKELGQRLQDVGLHLYYPSRGLNTATFHGDVYGVCAYLDKFLVNHYDFCSTGMTHLKDGCNWDFAVEYMDFEMLEAFEAEPEEVLVREFEEYFEGVQDVLVGFHVSNQAHWFL